MFRLDPQLERDTASLAAWPLSRVLLMRDARYPWLILVPARDGLVELHDLDGPDRALLIEEIARASRALAALTAPDKINVGALGNIVRQLHIHVVARRAGDPAWPGPVWGHGAAVPYGETALAEIRDRLVAALAETA